MRDAWKRAARAPQLGLAGLLLLLSLACASASAPVTPAPRVSTGTPVADGIVQTTIEAATPTPPRTSKATPERTGEIQASDNDSKDTSDSVQRSGGTSGGGQARPSREAAEMAVMKRRRPSREAAEPAATTRRCPSRIRAS